MEPVTIYILFMFFGLVGMGLGFCVARLTVPQPKPENIEPLGERKKLPKDATLFSLDFYQVRLLFDPTDIVLLASRNYLIDGKSYRLVWYVADQMYVFVSADDLALAQ